MKPIGSYIIAKDELGEFKSEDWDYVGLYKTPLFALWFWSSWSVEELCRTAELPDTFYGYLSIRGGHTFYPRAMKEALAPFVREKLTSDSAYFARVSALAHQEFDDGVCFAESYDTSRPLEELFGEMIKRRMRMQFFWSLGAMMAIYFIDEILAEAASTNDMPLDEVASHIPKPDTPMIGLEQHLSVLRDTLHATGLNTLSQQEVAAAVRTIPALRLQFEAFAREYDWIQEMNWIGEPTTLEDLVPLVLKPAQDEWHAVGIVPIELQNALAVAGHVAFWRQGGSEYCSIFETRVRPIMERVAEKVGVAYRELLRCSPDEILQEGAFSNNLKEIIRRRSDDTSAVFTANDGSVRVIDTDVEIKALSDALIPAAQSDINELHGEIAYHGHVQGRARVITNQENFVKLQEGDVLVAPMTTQHYMLLIQKSVAIVTDMGGLLCHAAIISRELKKPCIIGTKIATQVLKDGDLVEVDANKGVVRILERK